MRNMFGLRHTSKDRGGFSIPEAVIALGISAFAVAGGMAINQGQLRMVKSTRESNSASLALEERVEQLRLATWKQITDTSYIQNTFFKSKPKSSKALGALMEYVTITAFPDSSACTPLQIESKSDGSAQVVQGGAGLDSQRLAKVNVGVTWSGKDGRRRTRELATVISNGGISRMNLPAMGAGAEGTTSTTGTTTSTDTTTGSTVESATDTASGNGNGNGGGYGRGNVGGKPGKA